MLMRMLQTVLLLCFIAAIARAEAAENLLLITFDGLRSQEVFGGADARLLAPEAKAAENIEEMRARFWADTPEARRENLLPFLWRTIVPEGQLFGAAALGSPCRVTNGRNFSYPGYNELLTGAGDPRIDSNDKKYNRNTTVLEWINAKPEYAGKVFAFGSWDVFPFIINTERSGVPVNAGWEGIAAMPDKGRARYIKQLAAEIPHVWAGVRYDWFTFAAAGECIRQEQPRVLYVSFGETDDWAHEKRYDLYLDSASRTDRYIKELWELLQSMPQYAGKTALLLATDHGRGDTPDDWNSHGAKIPGADGIWCAALGAGVPAKGVVAGVPTTQSQYAATGAALLSLDFAAAYPGAAAPISLGK